MTALAPQPVTPGRRRRDVALRVVCVVIALGLLGYAAWLGVRYTLPPSDALLDLDGRAVILDPAPDVEAADPVPLGGVFAAPGQGLEAPLVAMNVVQGVINPPTLTDAFLVRDFGTPGDDASGLVVVAFHAVRAGNGVGNAFFDMRETSPLRVAAGDPLWVDGVEFVVTDAQVLGKEAAATSADVWGNAAERHGELVVLTCLQRLGMPGAASENLVIFAQRVR